MVSVWQMQSFQYLYMNNNDGCWIRWNIIVMPHSKNSQVRFDPEKGPMGPDPFLGQTDLESG